MVSVTPAIVRLLQQQLVTAVVTQSPLEGQTESLNFPDLKYVLESDEKVISAENLAGSIDSEVPLVILTSSEIDERIDKQGQFAYLTFRPPEIIDNKVRLTLELHMAVPGLEPLPLGAVIAIFAEVPGSGWQVEGAPAALGY